MFHLHITHNTGKYREIFLKYFGRGADNPTLENTLVTKPEEAIAGYFSWQKLLRKSRAHVGLSRQ
jgi:hypothetical protein